MKLRYQALALAATALVVGSAHALVDRTSTGNSSVVFIAVDANDNISLAIDLGINMSYFTNSTAWVSELQTTGPKTWNFATDTASEAGITGNAWSAAYNVFAATQTGGDFRWGVVAGDSVTGGLIAGRGMLATGNATEAQMLAAATSSPTGNALGNLNNYIAGNEGIRNATTTWNTAGNGATVADPTNGVAYLGANNSIQGNFNGTLTWNYLMANGATSTFQWQQQVVANPVIVQFGITNATDTLAAQPVQWQFDLASNTLVLSAVPEPGTYAMLLAGLAAVGFMARRRAV